MKTLLSVLLFILFTASLACYPVNGSIQNNTNSNANAGQRPADNNKVGGQRTTLNEQGITSILPIDWRKDESTNADAGEFTWHGPDKAEFSIIVSYYKSEYGNHSIEEETDEDYRSLKKIGHEDVRLLEINGVRGVHFLPLDDERWKVREDGQPERDQYSFIRWTAQRMYKGKRQTILVILSSPVRSFSRYRDTLYGILNSIKFIQE
jgi:hypothetical protein